METTRSMRVIGVASELGAAEPGCAAAPEALARSGFFDRLGLAAGLSFPVLRPAPGAGREEVSALCARLAAEVERACAFGLPFVIGGDHSIAAGTWRGVARAAGAAPGLIWIDAHLDAHTPRTSPSGAFHGMPLAALLGVAGAEWAGAGAVLDPASVCVVGARSFEPEEAALLLRLGVRVFTMAEIARRGVRAVMEEALAIATRSAAGFGVSIDVDALDPTEAPATGTPVPGGLAVAALAEALGAAAREPGLRAVELAEYVPRLDADGATARALAQLVCALRSGREPSTAIETERRYSAAIYAPAPVVLTRARGAWVWDERGRRYLDLLTAYSAVSFGHAHPRILAALESQARRLAVTSRVFHNEALPRLLEKLCRLTGMDRALPANTGLEAVEAALKAARKWGYRVKGIAPDRAEIIACEGNFHGRSIALVGLSSEPQYRDGFGPFPPGLKLVPYGDAAALAAAITPYTAAFLVEPIQGEGGIVVPPAGYLAECAAICRAHNVLLIADEVQTGLGRTGRLLACEHEGVKPDGLCLGKGLGGGVLPVSAFLAREDVMRVFRPGDHGSTFGGNPLAAAVAYEALCVLDEERLWERAAELGAYFIERLRAMRSPLVREVRGRGLFVGIEVNTNLASPEALALALLERGVLTKDTRGRVLRFVPPLTVTREELDWGIERLRETLAEFETRIGAAA